MGTLKIHWQGARGVGAQPAVEHLAYPLWFLMLVGTTVEAGWKEKRECLGGGCAASR